jgi:hypothetical protein
VPFRSCGVLFGTWLRPGPQRAYRLSGRVTSTKSVDFRPDASWAGGALDINIVVVTNAGAAMRIEYTYLWQPD